MRARAYLQRVFKDTEEVNRQAIVHVREPRPGTPRAAELATRVAPKSGAFLVQRYAAA
jgi:hypothetical protein